MNDHLSLRLNYAEHYFRFTMSGCDSATLRAGSGALTRQHSFDQFDASDFVNLVLSPISSTFGIFVWLGNRLRDQSIDPLAEPLYGEERIDAALRLKHREVFFVWIGLTR